MPVTTTDIALDLETLFTDAFVAEVDKRKEKPGAFDPTDWRAGGRASKAWPNKEDATWWLTNGPAMVEKWADWWLQRKAEGFTIWHTPTGLPAVELGLNVILAGKMFKCYIDAVMVDPDGQLLVVDWKTGREPVAPMQLGFYKVAIEKTFQETVVPFGTHYLARTADFGHVYDLSIYTEKLVGTWLTRAADIESRGDFVPHPSSLCSACGVRPYCRVMGGELAETVPDF